MAPRRPMPSLNEIASAHWQLFDSIRGAASTPRPRAAVSRRARLSRRRHRSGWAPVAPLARPLAAQRASTPPQAARPPGAPTAPPPPPPPLGSDPVAPTAVAIDAGHASALRPTGVGVAERLSREPRWRSSGRPARVPILRSRVGGHSKIHRHRRVRAQRVLPRRWHRRENARDQSQQPRAGRPEHDLTLNFSKCEIVCTDADVALFRNEFPEITSIVPVSSFFLLGTPLGSAEVARAKVEAAAERSTRRARLINALPDPVVATALLRHTTGFCIGNFYARGVGVLARTWLFFADSKRSTFRLTKVVANSLVFQRRAVALVCEASPTTAGSLSSRQPSLRTNSSQHFSRNERAINSHGRRSKCCSNRTSCKKNPSGFAAAFHRSKSPSFSVNRLHQDLKLGCFSFKRLYS
jgi:hypothetical protein